MDPKSYAQFMAMKEQEARAAAAAAEAAKPKPSAPARAVAPKAAKPSAGLAPAKSVAQAPPPKQTSTSAAPVVTPPAQPATQKPKVDPDLLQDLKVEDLYRVARDLPEVNASILAIRPQTNLSIPRYRELAAIHSIDLDDLHKSARSGMPFENYKKAKKDAIGFLPADQRATRFDEVVKDYETAQKGEIRTDKRLDLAPAEEAPATIKGFTEGYVIGNTSTEETPEVAKEGEHYYAIAQAYLKAVDSSPEVVKLVDLYANSLAGGATQQYINERTKQIMKNKGIGPGSPDADRQAALARRQALYDVLARKTVGQWTPGIFVKDVQVTDDAKATDNPFAALGPNVELIGFNNKGNAVFRQESPAGVALRTLDVIGVVPVPGKKLLPIPGQSVITGLVSKKDNETYSEAVSRGVSTGANWLELALDATKEQPLPLRAAAGVAGLGAAIIHPDVTAAAGSLGDAARAARVARINKQVAKEAVPLLEELVTAYKANDFEKAEKVEKKIAASELLGRSKQHSVVKAFNRADAAFIEALAAIDPTVKSLDPFLVDNLVAQVARRNPQLVEFIYESAGKGAPHMHFAKAAPELAARGKSGEAEATMMSFLDAGNFPRRKQRIELARAAYLKSVPKTAEEALTKGTDDLIQSIRGRANDARVMGVPEADVARDLRLADLMEQYKADLLEDPTSWQKEDGAFRTALREDPVTGGDAGKEFRAKSYRTDISRAVKRTQALKEVDYDTVLKEDMRVFDDALRAVDTNVKSRIMAAESLRRNLADKAEIRITPIDILDDLKDPGTERLSPMAQATFLTTMRQLPPEADRADWMRTFQALDAGLRGVAQRTGKSVEEVWRDILVQVQNGEGELAKAIKREARKAPAPAPGAPPAAAVTPPAPPPSTTPTVPNTPEIQAAVDKVAKGGKAGPAPKLNPRTVELVAKLDEKLQAKPDNVSKILNFFDKLGPGAPWPTNIPGQPKVLIGAIREQLLESGDLVKLEDGKVVKAGGEAPPAAPAAKVEPEAAPAQLDESRAKLSDLRAKADDLEEQFAEAVDDEEAAAIQTSIDSVNRQMEDVEKDITRLEQAPAPAKIEAPPVKDQKEVAARVKAGLNQMLENVKPRGRVEAPVEAPAPAAVEAAVEAAPVEAKAAEPVAAKAEEPVVEGPVEPVVEAPAPAIVEAPAPAKAAKAPRGKKAAAAVPAPAPAPVPEAPAPVTAPVAAPAPVVRAAPVPKTLENLGNASIWKKVKAPMKGLPESLETDVSGVKFRLNAIPTDAGKAPEFRVVMKLGGEVQSLGGKFASVDEALAAMPSLRADIDAFVRKQMPGAAEAGKKPRGRGRQKTITEPEVTPAKAETSAQALAREFNDAFGYDANGAVTASKLKNAARAAGEIAAESGTSYDDAFAKYETLLVPPERASAVAIENTLKSFRTEFESGVAQARALATPSEIAAAAPTLTVAEKLEKVKEELRKVTHSAFRDDVQVFGRVDDEGNFVPMYDLSGAEAAGGRSAEVLYNKVLGGMGSPEKVNPLAKSGAKPVSVEPVIKKLDRMADEGDLYQTGVVEAEKGVGRLVEKGKTEFLTPQQMAELRDQDAPTAVITLFRGVADPTTLVHEVGHYIRKMALDQSDMDAITKWIKSKGVDVEHKFGDFTGSAEDIRQAEELFAQAFEEYLALGKAPTPQLEALFQKVKEVFAKVYRTLSRGPLGEEIDEDVKVVFDRLFTEVPEKPPETTFDLIMRQTFNNKGLEPEGGLTVLARESKRRGIDSVTYLKKGDTVATKYPTTEEGLAKLVAQAYQDMGEAGWSGGTIIKFPTNVFGKSEWTGADIVEMSTRVQTRRNDFELAPLKQALFGDPEEETATENIFRAVEQREETGPFKGLKTVARGAGRGLAHSVLGGDITQERAVRNLLPAVRRNLDTSVRIVEQAIGDTISVLSQTIRTGEMDFLYRYLAGDTGLVYSSGRRVISSGHEFIDGFLDLYRNAGNSLTQDERALLQDLANAINTRPLPGNLVTPQQRSEALARLVYPDLDDLDTDVKNPIRQAMQARATAMQDALEKFRSLRGSGDKGVGSQLAKAMKSASKEGTPSINEYRFAETLLYLSGITARNGEMFVPVGKNYSNDQLKTAAQILLDDAQKIYGSDTDQLFARRLAILVGAYGAASRAKAELAELGLVLRREEAFAYNNWVLAYTVEPEMRVRLEGVMRKLGANTQFTADTILGADVYIPTQARERIAEALGKAQFSEQRLTKMGDMYQMAYAFMKKRMTRGNFVLRQRYFMVNTIDHFFQMSLIVGYGPAFQSVARIALQNAMASLPGQLAEMMLRAGSRITNGRLDPAYIEKFRDLLSRGGDKVAGSLREMMGGSKYRVEVNHILEGRNMPIILGGHVTTAKRLREIMVAEGILESYNTRRLGAVIRQEGTAFINDGDGFIQAGIDDRTLGGNVATGWAKVRDAAADMTVNVVDDIGDAWAERERVGAAVTLIETGIEPRAACRLTVDALYDYAQSMTKMDRNLLWGLLFPFWAFQKNANQQFINVLSRPYGAYRMMVLKRFRDRGGELLTELYYDAVGGELGLDVNSMPQDMQDLYYAIMTQAHEVYGDEIPEDAKLALRLALTGRSAEVVQGKYYELDASLIDMLRSGGVAGVGGVAMSEYMLPRPDRAGLPSYVRDRPGVLLAQRRNALVRLYSGLSGKNDKMFFLMMPEASFESAMKHTSSVLATSMLMAGYVSSAIPGSKALGLTERGLQGTDILQAIKPVIDLERSPIAGPVINLYAQRGYPKRVHPAIAKIMMDMMDVPILRVPAVDDPFENEQFIQEMETPDENGQPRDIAQILGADRVRSIQELNDRDIDPTDVSRIREERYYLPPGGYSIAFENSPFLGEFNTELLNKLAASPAEQADAAGKVLYAARLLTGLEVSEVSASRTAQMEEPVFYTKSQKPF